MVLTALLRLRQLCCHPSLCPLEVVESVQELQKTLKAQLEPLVVARVLSQVSSEDSSCSICLSDKAEMVNPVVTACGHVFCKGCIEQVLQKASVCPLCRGALPGIDELTNLSDLQKGPESLEAGEEDEPEVPKDRLAQKSSKVVAILDELAGLKQTDPLGKVVIFSQFTSFLHILGHHLSEAGVSFCQIVGSMSQKARKMSLDAFGSRRTESSSCIYQSRRTGTQHFVRQQCVSDRCVVEFCGRRAGSWSFEMVKRTLEKHFVKGYRPRPQNWTAQGCASGSFHRSRQH